MNSTNKFLLILAMIFLTVAVIFGWLAIIKNREIKILRAQNDYAVFNKKIILFERAFIEKVLKAESEIDFETRLQLENMVRDLQDQQILAQWQAFTNSQTEETAQRNVRELLWLLANKVEVK